MSAEPEPEQKKPQPVSTGMPMPKIDNYKERMKDVLAMLEKAEEVKNEAKGKDKAKDIVDQGELDAVFGNFMSTEYADD